MLKHWIKHPFNGAKMCISSDKKCINTQMWAGTSGDHVFYRETPHFEWFLIRQKTDVTNVSLLMNWQKVHDTWQIEVHKANINAIFLLFIDKKAKFLQIIRPWNCLPKYIKWRGDNFRWYLTKKRQSSKIVVVLCHNSFL